MPIRVGPLCPFKRCRRYRKLSSFDDTSAKCQQSVRSAKPCCNVSRRQRGLAPGFYHSTQRTSGLGNLTAVVCQLRASDLFALNERVRARAPTLDTAPRHSRAGRYAAWAGGTAEEHPPRTRQCIRPAATQDAAPVYRVNPRAAPIFKERSLPARLSRPSQRRRAACRKGARPPERGSGLCV